MNIQWWRSWHGAPTDSKWLLIGRIAKVPPGIVSAVAWAIFDHASQHETRGSVEGFDPESYAAFAGFEDEQVRAIIQAMTTKGVIVDGVLKAWEKRQPKREDTSAERTKGYRERKRKVTQGDAVVTQCDAQASTVTQGDAPEKTRPEEEERREESGRPPIEAPPKPSVESENRGEVVASQPSAEPAKAKRGTRLKEDWVPSEADIAFALGKGFSLADIEREATRFRNYWVAKPKDATKLSWPLTWQNWMMAAPKAKPIPGAPVPYTPKAKLPPRVMLDVATYDEQTWAPLIRRYLRDQTWDTEALGPDPESKGTRIPPEVLKALGIRRRPPLVNFNNGRAPEPWPTSPTSEVPSLDHLEITQ